MEIDRSTQSVLSYGRLIGEFADRWAQIMNFAKGRYLDKTITISKIQLGLIWLAQNSPVRPLVFQHSFIIRCCQNSPDDVHWGVHFYNPSQIIKNAGFRLQSANPEKIFY